jgi:hypothetical protein
MLLHYHCNGPASPFIFRAIAWHSLVYKKPETGHARERNENNRGERTTEKQRRHTQRTRRQKERTEESTKQKQKERGNEKKKRRQKNRGKHTDRGLFTQKRTTQGRHTGGS